LPDLVGVVSRYREQHRIANFAANLEKLKLDYCGADAESAAQLSRRFSSILDALVLPNGVSKSTWANRLGRSLSTVLSAVALPTAEIRVLDVPSSAGLASLQLLAILQQRYRVTSYVLGDKYHELLYDPRRGCIFDAQGNLLQVAFRKYYFSPCRGRADGDTGALLRCLRLPHHLVAWYLRRRYRFAPELQYRRVSVVHPEVERLRARRIVQVREMDVFQPIPGRYDLILSFNLLHRNYFPADAIRAGVNNLAASLSEGGLLILGNTDSFLALQKRNGALVARLQEGSFLGEAASLV
jgi:phosphoribosylcarboxyaminoimidazole (NCAIR) mutase